MTKKLVTVLAVLLNLMLQATQLLDQDLKRLQGKWTFVGARNYAFEFVFKDSKVSFGSSGIRPMLPRLSDLPFNLEAAGTKRFISLKLPKDIKKMGSRIQYWFEKEQLKLSIELDGKAVLHTLDQRFNK